MANPNPDHVAVLLAQGRAWIADLAQVGHWLDQHEADELAALQACPLPDLPAHVERLRVARWEALPRIPMQRSRPTGDDLSCQPQRRPRGLARHLYAKGKP